MRPFYLRRFAMLALVAALFSTPVLAQEQQGNPSAIGCIDPVVRQKAQDIKDHYTKQGFTIMKDAMVSVESMTQYPVIVALKQGELYLLCYVANPSYQNVHLTLYDGNDAKLDQKDIYKNREQPNYLIMTFSPTVTDEYLITIMQKLKNKTVCGNFFILKADPSKTPETIEPYTETKQ